VLALASPARASETHEPQAVSEAQVDAVIRAHFGELESCYRGEKKRLDVSAGRIDLHWEFRGEGQVGDAHAIVDTLGSPELRQCAAEAVRRWKFPRVSTGWVSVNRSFSFGPAGVSFGKAAAALSAVPKISDARALRALLLRFGPQLVSFACVAGRRSFLGRVCDTPIDHNPRVRLDARYTNDQAVAKVVPGLLRFAFQEVDARGFSLGGWPRPPTSRDSDTVTGPFDGFAVWPPDAFKVSLTPYGEWVVHNGVRSNCRQRPWSPCRDADRPADGGKTLAREPVLSSPLAEGALARDAERLLAPILKRFTEKRRLRLMQTLSVDLDGDGKEEKLHNLALTDVELRPGKPGAEELESELPWTFFFILLEREGRLSRLPVETASSQLDGMDGAVLGWLDVDADGGRELLLETPGFEIQMWQVVRFRDGAFHPVAEFGFHYMGEIGYQSGER